MLAAALPATARAETGYDAWLRYAPLPEPTRSRYAALPRTVTLLGDTPVLRSARDEIVRGLTLMLNGSIAAATALPRSSSIVIGTMDRVRPAMTGVSIPVDVAT